MESSADKYKILAEQAFDEMEAVLDRFKAQVGGEMPDEDPTADLEPVVEDEAAPLPEIPVAGGAGEDEDELEMKRRFLKS